MRCVNVCLVNQKKRICNPPGYQMRKADSVWLAFLCGFNPAQFVFTLHKLKPVRFISQLC